MIVTWFLSRWISLEKKLGLRAVRKCSSDALPADLSKSSDSREMEAKIRAFLRRWPLWVDGHRELFNRSLDVNDLETAYASAHAVRKLQPDSPEGQVMLGICFVRSGQFERAVQVLSAALEQSPEDIRVKEELIAALLPLNRREEAAALLKSIPPEKRPVAVQVLARVMEC
jgi:tetratricopeptide (TPR) repeat protein